MMANPLLRLRGSKWRTSFSLSGQDKEYIRGKGLLLIEHECRDIIQRRLSNPYNDGSQTPYRGHPVFTAQHATATCCRKCLERWHGISRWQPLAKSDCEFVTKMVMKWMRSQLLLAGNSLPA